MLNASSVGRGAVTTVCEKKNTLETDCIVDPNNNRNWAQRAISLWEAYYYYIFYLYYITQLFYFILLYYIFNYCDIIFYQFIVRLFILITIWLHSNFYKIINYSNWRSRVNCPLHISSIFRSICDIDFSKGSSCNSL